MRGEVTTNAYDPSSKEQRRVKYHASSDARIVETEYEFRSVIRWHLPVHIQRSGRKLKAGLSRALFILGGMMNGSKTLSEGYALRANLGIFKPVDVKYYYNKFGELISVKGDTGTTGQQEPSNQGISTSPTTDDRGRPEMPPAPIEEPPEQRPGSTTVIEDQSDPPPESNAGEVEPRTGTDEPAGGTNE